MSTSARFHSGTYGFPSLFRRRGRLAAALFCAALARARLPASEAVPLSLVFRHIGINAVHSAAYNYGANFLAAGFGTWALVASGADWRLNRLVYEHPAASYAGYPALFIGYAAPFAAPIAFYCAGRAADSPRAQFTALALGQSLIITTVYTSAMKAVTGRASPGLASVLDHERSARTDDYSRDFAWGFARRGIIAGWPSAHTANAFAAAAVIAELYRGALWVPLAAYSYAVFIGAGVALCVHWPSEVLAGALIGYAVGKTVGKDFARLREGRKEPRAALFCAPGAAGVRFRW